jgi:hypothetical protein
LQIFLSPTFILICSETGRRLAASRSVRTSLKKDSRNFSTMARPSKSDYIPFYETYISLVKENDIKEALQQSLPLVESFLDSIPQSKADFAYADGKWTIKQLIQHGIDAERIFCYRALCIARGESQNLPGFEENEYAQQATVDHRTLRELRDEFPAVRKASILLFNSFTQKMLEAKGSSNNHPISTLSLGYIIVGHWKHHQRILTERYLNV